MHAHTHIRSWTVSLCSLFLRRYSEITFALTCWVWKGSQEENTWQVDHNQLCFLPPKKSSFYFLSSSLTQYLAAQLIYIPACLPMHFYSTCIFWHFSVRWSTQVKIWGPGEGEALTLLVRVVKGHDALKLDSPQRLKLYKDQTVTALDLWTPVTRSRAHTWAPT